MPVWHVAAASPVAAEQAASDVHASQLAPAHPAGHAPAPPAAQVQVSPEGVVPVSTASAREGEGAPASDPRTGSSPPGTDGRAAAPPFFLGDAAGAGAGTASAGHAGQGGQAAGAAGSGVAQDAPVNPQRHAHADDALAPGGWAHRPLSPHGGSHPMTEVAVRLAASQKVALPVVGWGGWVV